MNEENQSIQDNSGVNERGMSPLTNAEKLKLLIIDKFGARVFTRQEVLNEWTQKYPNSSLKSVLPGDYCVNLKTARHHKQEVRFLFYVKDGVYRIYDKTRDGEWELTDDGVKQVK